MNIPCCINSPCQDPASPFLNLSAEGPDPNVFIGFPPPGNNDPPQLGWTFTNTACNGVHCTSSVSQLEADLCAARLAVECLPECELPGGCWRPPGVPPGDPPPPTIFRNIVAGCTVFCPDGLPFNFAVPAGTVEGLNQDYCNQIAQSLACGIGQQEKMCLSSISSNACFTQPYSGVIFATGGNTPYFYSLVSGSLPPGINLTQPADGLSLIVSGTALAVGTFNFTIQVVDRFGLYMRKTYTIQVGTYANNNPTAASVNSPYSFQFTAVGGTPPFHFSIASGTLPPGLSMSDSGLITGTPTNDGTFNFGVRVTDSSP